MAAVTSDDLSDAGLPFGTARDIAVGTAPAFAQQNPSPAATASVRIGGKALSIQYSAPSVRGRQIFGAGGLLSKDPTYPVWRAGANAATTFKTDADLDLGGLTVPTGTYTLYVLDAQTAAIHGTDRLIWTLPFVLYGVFRYLYALHHKGAGADPARDLLRDPHLWGGVLGWLALTAWLIAPS